MDKKLSEQKQKMKVFERGVSEIIPLVELGYFVKKKRKRSYMRLFFL